MRYGHHITTRVNDRLHKKLIQYCEYRGVARSEGLRILLSEYFDGARQKTLEEAITENECVQQTPYSSILNSIQVEETLKPRPNWNGYTVVCKRNTLVKTTEYLQNNGLQKPGHEIDDYKRINVGDVRMDEHCIVYRSAVSNYYVYINDKYVDND